MSRLFVIFDDEDNVSCRPTVFTVCASKFYVTRTHRARWLFGVVVRTLDLRLSRCWFESQS